MELLIAVTVESQRGFNAYHESERTLWRVHDDAKLIDIITASVSKSYFAASGRATRCSGIEIIGAMNSTLRHAYAALLDPGLPPIASKP